MNLTPLFFSLVLSSRFHGPRSRFTELGNRSSWLMVILRGGMDFGSVVQAGVPAAAALRGEVQEVPDGREQVDATLVDVGGHPGMRQKTKGSGSLNLPFIAVLCRSVDQTIVTINK